MYPEEIIKIKRLLKERNLEHLYCKYLEKRSYESVIEILDLPYWKEKDEKGNLIYQGLLTSNIWNSNKEQIEEILSLPYWKNPIYQHLLTSSLWAISSKRIIECIEFFESLGLESFITMSVFKKSKLQILSLIKHLKENNLPLIINKKLNPIFNVAPIVLKKKYNIDLKELEKKYRTNGELELCLC